MMKVLFLPLFNMPSGHHQVADALKGMINNRTDQIECKKVELLSYSNEIIEKMVSNLYLKWISHTPKTYDWAYKHFAYTNSHKHSSFKGIEIFYLLKLEKLLKEEQPDLIVCTHGFPSLLLSRMKMVGKCPVPVINVYTDFFINDIWGRSGIDYHFVSTKKVKETLTKAYNIPENKVIVTGIPVDETFIPKVKRQDNTGTKRILIAGGSSGLGDIIGLIKSTKPEDGFEYIILCGKNQQLFQDIQSLGLQHVKPLPYLSSREEMNRLYDQVDAIVTKPGGVTVSEALRKRLPIFIHSSLPGQEEINRHYLKENGLVFPLDSSIAFEEQISCVINNDLAMKKFGQAIDGYNNQIELRSPNKLFNFIYANASEGVYANSFGAETKLKLGIVNIVRKYTRKKSISGNI